MGRLCLHYERKIFFKLSSEKKWLKIVLKMLQEISV